jgi:hypothetical protein
MRFLLPFLALPLAVFAAPEPTSFKSLVGLIVGIINNLIYIIFALSILVFIWGVVNAWIIHGGDADRVQQGRKFILISIITLVVMTSLWGIVNILRATLFGS